MDGTYDLLWKMRTMLDRFSASYAKYYSPAEHLAVREIIVLFKVSVIFSQYVLKNSLG
jgi:hypothetical protein